MTDSIPINYIEIELASQTPEQDRDNEDFLTDSAPSSDGTATYQLTAEDVNAILMMVTQRDGESPDDYERRLKLSCNHITQHDGDTSSDVAYYSQFVSKRSLHHPTMKHVSPQPDHVLIIAQLNDRNVRRMIRIIRDGELLPSHPNLESQFLKKPIKNWNWLQVINNVLYRQYSEHTGSPINKQLVVPDNIIDDEDISGTLRENPMQGHPGESKTLKVLRS